MPTVEVIETEIEIQRVPDQPGFPLIIKPLDGNHGRRETTNSQTREALISAFQIAKAYSEGIVVMGRSP